MSGDRPALRIFVAMPGTTMGERAAWNNIEEIKKSLLQPVADKLQAKFGRPASLVIEKDKTSIQPIHRSMFTEALDAEVYIADLSGANPNVYLELGVRWALRDGVTIPICQDLAEVTFNVSSTRVIQYGPNPTALTQAIGQIVDAASQGLLNANNADNPDNPVRDSLDLVLIKRDSLKALRDEITRLKGQQAEDLVGLALESNSPHDRVDLLRRAVDRNPANLQARFHLGVSLRRQGDYGEAIQVLQEITAWRPDYAPAWRELGVAFSKSGQLAVAVDAFGRATSLDGSDAETFSTYGGVLRRLARGQTSGSFNWDFLRQAREVYQKASDLSGNDTYPLINEARVRFLLSAIDVEDRPSAIENFSDLSLLALYVAKKSGWVDPWKLFDLSDTYLFAGRVGEALEILHKGIALIDMQERRALLTSVIEPLNDFIGVPGLLNESTAVGVQKAIEICTVSVAEAS